MKPFSFQELEARIKALLRRGKERPDRQLWCHDLVLDCDTRRARRGDTVIELTVKEYRLLEYFMTHQGVALSRLVLLKDVWDKNFDTNTNVVDVYVNYLRNKIDRDFEVKLIRTIVGMGYIMGGTVNPEGGRMKIGAKIALFYTVITVGAIALIVLVFYLFTLEIYK
mgnify:CR=1 FL=1